MTAAESPAVWPVAIFAHNEGRFIVDSIESVLGQSGVEGRLRIHVLANGCSDDTEAHVQAVSREHENVELVSIAKGDKSNAWNVYAHEVAERHPVHFFLDGDTRAAEGALSSLAAGLTREPHANGAAAFPFSGRSAGRWSRFIHTQHGMPGCLYALRGSFLARVKAAGVRLPVGFIGEDVLLQFLVKTDLEPERNTPDRGRIALCEDAGFEFDSMSLADLRDWRLYWRRNVRNAEREYQARMLLPMLREHGLGAMPKDVEALYRGFRGPVPPAWAGHRTVFKLMAARKIRRVRAAA